MAKFAAQAVQDASLDLIATATELYICNGQPATRAAAISQARHAAAIAMVGGDFVKSSASTDRVLTVAAKLATANSTGTVDHVALCTASTLLYVTTAPALTATSGQAVNSSSFTVTASALV
jgi:hypothetical protein